MNKRTFLKSITALLPICVGLGGLSVVEATSNGKVYMHVSDGVDYMTFLTNNHSQLHMAFEENGEWVTYIVNVDRSNNIIVGSSKKSDSGDSSFNFTHTRNNGVLVIKFNEHISVEFR